MSVFRSTTIKLGPGEVAPSTKKTPAAKMASHAIGSMYLRVEVKPSTLLKNALFGAQSVFVQINYNP